MKRAHIIALALAALTPNCASPQALESVMVETVAYARAATETGEMQLSLDLYRPSVHHGRLPTLIVMHGGGFIGGARDLQENIELSRALAARGYAVASISYRLMHDRPTVTGWGESYAAFIRQSDHPLVRALVASQGASWPVAVAAAAEDEVSALTWVREHADAYNLDPDRIALIGMSAGAITSTMLAYRGRAFGAPVPRVSAVVCIRGAILGAEGSDFRNGPPLLIAHGMADSTVPLSEAQHLFELARAGGAPVEFYSIPDATHELGGAALLETTLENGVAFIDRLDRFLRAAFFTPNALLGATCIGPDVACVH